MTELDQDWLMKADLNQCSVEMFAILESAGNIADRHPDDSYRKITLETLPCIKYSQVLRMTIYGDVR